MEHETLEIQDKCRRRQKGPGVLYYVCISLLVLTLSLATCWVIRLAYANLARQQGTPEAIGQAIRLDPLNADYRAALADALEYEHQNPEKALLNATQLDPLNSAYWIRRGIRAEIQGNATVAERLYLEAARVDFHFGPRIALMNFYFRQGETQQFWNWARLAFERSYGDMTGTFELCWRVSPDPKVILERALPHDPTILAAFLQFVSAQAGDNVAAPVAGELLQQAGPATTEALLDYCDRLLTAKKLDLALEIWLVLSHRGLLPENGSRNGNLLTNARFRSPFSQRGFDWKLTADPEIRLIAGDPPDAFSVSLSGKQPELCEILSQVVPIEAGDRYGFHVEYRTTSVADSGLAWHVENAFAPGTQMVVDLPQSENWNRREATFEARGTRFARVSLVYARASGTVRYDGRLLVRALSLSRVIDGR
jgi:hypothetical protein